MDSLAKPWERRKSRIGKKDMALGRPGSGDGGDGSGWSRGDRSVDELTSVEGINATLSVMNRDGSLYMSTFRL